MLSWRKSLIFLVCCSLLQVALAQPAFVDFHGDIYQGIPSVLNCYYKGSSATVQLYDLGDKKIGPSYTLKAPKKALELTLRNLPEGKYQFEITENDSGETGDSGFFQLDADIIDSPSSSSSLSPTTQSVVEQTTTPSKTPSSPSSKTTTTTSSDTSPTPDLSDGTSRGTSPQATPTSNEPTSSPPSSSSDSNSSGGLSTGAKAGIGVGAALGALLIFGVIAWLIYRRGKAAGKKPEVGWVAEADDRDRRYPAMAEMGPQEPKPMPEMGGNPAAAEMGEWKRESAWQRAELA